MRFNADIVSQLTSEAKEKALKYILIPGFRMTGRELARLCGISHTMAIKILKEFETLNLVYNFRAGKSVVWMPRIDSYAYLVADEQYRKSRQYMPLEHLKKTLVEDLKGNIVKRAVLFGSVAEGKERSSSDIDLFVLVDTQKEKKIIEKKLEDASAKYITLYGNTLNPYVLTKKELQERKKLALIANIEKGVKLI